MGILDNLKGSLGGNRLPLLEGIDSVVGGNARFKGELNTSGSVNIIGEFEGKIISTGEVLISPGSKVTGEIHGGVVVVSGRVDGNITAKDCLEITKTGRVHGDLTGGKIIIEEGSSYQGKVSVTADEKGKEEDQEKEQEKGAEKNSPQIFPGF